LSSTVRAPLRSSQSTMIASNFSVRRISCPELTPRQTSTPTDSLSRAGWRTRITSGSRVSSRDSNGIEFVDGSVPARTGESDKGPRIIDIDILLFGNSVIATKGLRVPHPAMHARRFVLEPLAEIAPEVRHPIFNRTVRELKNALPAGQMVRRVSGVGPRTSGVG